MRNFKMILQYEGTRYKGWQRQESTEHTIQGKLESILTKMAGTPVEIQGSGRTDAGVHALGQVANFHADIRMSEQEIMNYVNSYLPEDIAVISVKEASERFHSRLNATGKTYCYLLVQSGIPHVFERRFAHRIEERLDVEAMEKAAGYLLGTHDFAAFTSTKRGDYIYQGIQFGDAHHDRSAGAGSASDYLFRGWIFVPYGPDSDRNTDGSRDAASQSRRDSGNT